MKLWLKQSLFEWCDYSGATNDPYITQNQFIAPNTVIGVVAYCVFFHNNQFKNFFMEVSINNNLINDNKQA